MYEIEKGVPMPRLRWRWKTGRKYPLDTMEVGDSFFVAGMTAQQFSGRVNYAAKLYGRRFSCRSVDGGVRVWRVE